MRGAAVNGDAAGYAVSQALAASSTASMPWRDRPVHKELLDPNIDRPRRINGFSAHLDYQHQKIDDIWASRPSYAKPTPSRQQGTRKPIRDVSKGKHMTGSLQEEDCDPEPVLLLQPETRPISHEQLVVEVKGIYAGLVMVEAKCIDIDRAQTEAALENYSEKREKPTNEQWQALIHLHKTLLHEHHDFFLASQHPSASPALSKLAKKYAMPARMWRHGIHSFLEVLRHRLPQSLDHMLAFIYIAYSMMALLYETVPAFEDTWIECLGDLGRYRMAIEDDDQRDRDVWSGVARFWYSKAADKTPDTGRLYHHLAILARPYTINQLSYYTRSLTCFTPFESARSSIMTLFDPLLNNRRLDPLREPGSNFIKVHAILFAEQAPYAPLWIAREGEFTRKCASQTRNVVPWSWRHRSSIANCVSDIAALANERAYVTLYPTGYFTNADNVEDEERAIEIPSMGTARQQRILWLPLRISEVQYYIPIRCRCPSATPEPRAPTSSSIDSPSAEDPLIRGQSYSRWYFPTNWFMKVDEENEEHVVETPATEKPRQPSIFWLYVYGPAFQNTLDYWRRLLATPAPRASTTILPRCIRALFVCLTIAPPVVAARPLPGSPPSPCIPVRRDLPTTVLTASAHGILTASILVGAHYLAEKKGHTSVYGFLMTVLAFGWWAIRNDVSTTSWSLWA